MLLGSYVVRARDDAELYKHDLRPVSELRARAAELLRAARKSRRPIILTEDGEPEGVLLDVLSYSKLRETELLLEVLTLGRRDGRLTKAPRRSKRRVSKR